MPNSIKKYVYAMIITAVTMFVTDITTDGLNAVDARLSAGRSE